MSRVGIVTNGVRNNEFGGSHIYLSQLCNRLIQNGWEVTLFSYESAFNVLPDRENFISLGEEFGTPKELISINRNLLKFESKFNNVDIIHTDWWLAAPALRRIADKYDIRYIQDSRNSLFDVNRIQNIYKGLILKFLHPDHIIFVDHVSHSLHQEKFNDGESSLIPVPIDTDMFRIRQDSTESTHDELHPFRLLFASWLRQEKGLPDLIESLENVWQIYPDTELLIAGEGYLRAGIESLAARDERITYLGRVSNQEMIHIYEQADLLVYPSYFEGFPRAILEAYACGVPTVATEVGGLSLLQEKGIGLIVQPGDVVNLAGAICQMIEKPDMREQFAQDGQAFVIEKHSWSVVVKKIMQLYTTNNTG